MNSPQACAFVREAEIPLTFRNGVPVVEVKVNGTLLHMILDTGVGITSITKDAADRAGVARDSTMRGYARGVGTEVVPVVIGNVGRLEMATARQTDMPVVVLNQTKFKNQVDGLLGHDVLSKYDLDLNLGKRSIALYAPRNCPSGPPNWPETATRFQRPAVGDALSPSYSGHARDSLADVA